ncbi:MAG: hypothetical protein ABIJ34_05045 [archaeon]
MVKNWNTTKLITVGSFGVLRVLIWLPFTLLVSTKANPFLLLFSFLFFSFISVLSLLIIRQFGTMTIQTFVEYCIELPLPSFAIKLLDFSMALIRSFLVDIIFHFTKSKEKLTSIISGGANSIILSLFYYVVYFILGIPGIEQVSAEFFTPIVVLGLLITVFIVGAIGGYFGYIVYNKIKNTAVVKRIQR